MQSTYKILFFLCLLVASISLFGHGFASPFGEFTVSDEKKLGEEFRILVKSSMPIIQDPEIKEYTESIVAKLLAVVPPQPFEFDSNVVYNPALNAFAAPGGYIVIFTGMLVEMDDEAQFAGILAHEIAHVTQRHIADRMERGQYASIASIATMVLGALAGGGEGTGAIMAAGMAVGQTAMLNYSRFDEDDADKFGMQYMVAAGYNPKGLAESFEILQTKSFGLGSDFPTYLSTHPDLNARIASVQSHAQSLPLKVRQLKSDNSAFFRVKALSMAYFADTRNAANYFRKKNTAWNNMGLGIVASRLHNVSLAQKYFTLALAQAPFDSLIWREAGRFYFEKGDKKNAYKHLGKALELKPDDYFAIFYHARLLAEDGKGDAAKKEYEKVLHYVPEDPEVIDYYGKLLGKNGQHFEGYLQLALASIYRNNPKRAMSWMQRATQSMKSDAQKESFKKVQTIFNQRKVFWK